MAYSPFDSLAKTGGHPIIFRSQGSRVYSSLGYLFCLGLFLTTIVESKYSSIENFAFNALTLLIAASVYLGIQRPALVFSDLALAVRNPFTTTILDWSQVSDVDTKFVLNINSELGIIKCWAAAGPSRSQHRAIHPSELRGFHQQGGGIKASGSPRSDSGAAAQIARIYMQKRGSFEESAIASEIKVSNLAKFLYAALVLAVIASHLIAYA
ncbi:MAG: PH domain-containing protein [Actinobacteria bacterium]|nr:PH domain-containing protein [Actinomycetota bacterium]